MHYNIKIYFNHISTRSKSSNLILVWYFFGAKNEKYINEMSSHCSRSTTLHYHLPFYESSYRCHSSKFMPFFTRTHHWTFTILKNALSSSFTKSPCTIHIQIGTRPSSCDLMKTKSPSLSSSNEMYVSEGRMFFGPQ
jgi:hypothetical protein